MFDKNNIVPCVDWFRGVVPVSDVRKFVNDLYLIDSRLSPELFECDGRTLLNFANRYCHIEVPSLTFAFNRDDSCDNYMAAFDDYMTASLSHQNAGILVSFSGDAIRYLGNDTFTKVLRYLHVQGTKCTRIDYALDFFDKDNDIVPLMQEGCANFMNPRTRDITVSGKIKRTPSNFQCYINAYKGEDSTVNYTLGNHGSDHGMFRLYDKRFEIMYGRHRQRSEELLQGRDYWYRAEIELHNSKDYWWADSSFHNLVENDFNIYASIGSAFDDWFSFKILVYSNRSEFDSLSDWDNFISDLIQTIHFVQLVHQKYVNRDTDYAWNQIIRNSTWLSLLLDVGDIDPGRFKEIIDNGRVKRQSNTSLRIKYGSIENCIQDLAITI